MFAMGGFGGRIRLGNHGSGRDGFPSVHAGPLETTHHLGEPPTEHLFVIDIAVHPPTDPARAQSFQAQVDIRAKLAELRVVGITQRADTVGKILKPGGRPPG